MSDGDVVLSVRKLDAFYGAAQVIFGVDLDLARGEVVALMGRNGAGKSTTIEAIMGLVGERRGAVTFLGADISDARPYEIARRGLGFVPEDRRIFGDLTVGENLEVGRLPPRADDAAPWTIERVFTLFPNLAEARNRPAAQMSGGEQQMLTVARTLMGNPRAILLDEPSEGVAPIIVDAMARTIRALKASGVAILLCEQNLAFATAVSDRVYLLEKGEVVFSGTMGALANDAQARRAYLEL